MYFQFLIEDQSTGILVEHVMKKLQTKYAKANIEWNIKSFTGIGHVPKKGKILERKTGKLLNDLPLYLRAFDRTLQYGKNAIIVVLDNDDRDVEKFRLQLEKLANEIQTDHAFCIAVKEMEAWLLGDEQAIREAYPEYKEGILKKYEQDSIADTWEVLADMVYPGGLKKLKKKADGAYMEIGKAKGQWADTIGEKLNLECNQSPSFQFFLKTLKERILCTGEDK